MTVVTIHQAKTNLSKLIKAARAGEEIIIARGKEPMVTLTPTAPVSNAVEKPRRVPGRLKGLMPVPPPEAFAPLTDEELRDCGLS